MPKGDRGGKGKTTRQSPETVSVGEAWQQLNRDAGAFLREHGTDRHNAHRDFPAPELTQGARTALYDFKEKAEQGAEVTKRYARRTLEQVLEAAKQKRIESARLVFGMNGAEETWESINYHRNKIEMWQRIEADIRKRLRR